MSVDGLVVFPSSRRTPVHASPLHDSSPTFGCDQRLECRSLGLRRHQLMAGTRNPSAAVPCASRRGHGLPGRVPAGPEASRPRVRRRYRRRAPARRCPGPAPSAGAQGHRTRSGVTQRARSAARGRESRMRRSWARPIGRERRERQSSRGRRGAMQRASVGPCAPRSGARSTAPALATTRPTPRPRPCDRCEAEARAHRAAVGRDGALRRSMRRSLAGVPARCVARCLLAQRRPATLARCGPAAPIGRARRGRRSRSARARARSARWVWPPGASAVGRRARAWAQARWDARGR